MKVFVLEFIPYGKLNEITTARIEGVFDNYKKAISKGLEMIQIDQIFDDFVVNDEMLDNFENHNREYISNHIEVYRYNINNYEEYYKLNIYPVEVE